MITSVTERDATREYRHHSHHRQLHTPLLPHCCRWRGMATPHPTVGRYLQYRVCTRPTKLKC